jgi:hypothetical protein
LDGTGAQAAMTAARLAAAIARNIVLSSLVRKLRSGGAADRARSASAGQALKPDAMNCSRIARPCRLRGISC